MKAARSPHYSWGFLGSAPCLRAKPRSKGTGHNPAHLIGPVSCKGSGPAPPCRPQVGSIARPRSALVAEVRSQLPPDRDWFGRHGVLNRRGRTQLTAAWSRHTLSMLGGERRIAFSGVRVGRARTWERREETGASAGAGLTTTH